MIQGHRKLIDLVVIALVLNSGAAHAERYIVGVKDQAGLAQIQSHFVLSAQGSRLAQVQGLKAWPHAVLTTELVGALPEVNAIVVDSATELSVSELMRSGSFDYVEKEFFRPAPRLMVNGRVQKFKAFEVSELGRTVGANTPWGIKAVKASEAWAAAKSGRGARVMVLDTGIDSNHPALKNNIEKTQDFTSSGSAVDTIGHGTHVAGTIVGELDAQGFSGVAPQAKVLMGKVCSEVGCSNVAVAEGIAWGMREKVDVISMSLGGPIGSMAEKRAVEAADAAGVTVVAASGNDSATRVSFPAAFPTVIAVGALDSSLKRAVFSNQGPELDVIAPGVAVVSTVPLGSGRDTLVNVNGSKVLSAIVAGTSEAKSALVQDLVFAGLGKPADFQAGQVRGKIALISRGEISFGDKFNNAIAAGAAGVLVYNNAPGLINATATQDGSVLPVPGMMIEQSVGEAVKTKLMAGQKVVGTLQTIATDYAPFDGTSMATPHVAGVIALVKVANPRLTPLEVRALLATTSTNLGPQLEYGAGIVNAEAAVSKALGR